MKNKRFLIISTTLILFLIISICVAGCNLAIAKKESNQKLEHSNSETMAENPNLLSRNEEEYFEILGYGQLEIDDEYPNINLINSSENNVYLSFDVFYNDELLYQTGLVSPGKMEQYNIYSRLDAGQYTLTYSINVYDMNENVLWSGIQQEQEILIKNKGETI